MAAKKESQGKSEYEKFAEETANAMSSDEMKKRLAILNKKKNDQKKK